MKTWSIALVGLLAACSAALAQSPPAAIGGQAPVTSYCWNGTALAVCGSAGTSGSGDPNNAAFQGVTVITPGTPFTAGRSIGFVLTTGCPETITFVDTSTITLTLTANAALQTLPFAATNVTASGCVGTFWNLK